MDSSRFEPKGGPMYGKSKTDTKKAGGVKKAVVQSLKPKSGRKGPAGRKPY